VTTLQNTVTEPDGSPVDGWLDVTLIGNPFQADSQTEILGPVKDRRFTDGAWSINLAPGLYGVTQRRQDGSFHSRWNVEVPDSESPVWLADCLVSVPGKPTTVPLRGIASSAVDDDGHLQLTYTDGTTLDAGLVTGPPGPPYTDSAAEFGQAMTAAAEDDSSDFAGALRDIYRALVAEEVVRASISSGTYTIDPGTTGTLILTLEGDATLDAGTGWVDGQSLLVRVFQDSAGGHTLTLPAAEGNAGVSLDETSSTFETLVYQFLTGVGLIVHQAPNGPFAAPAPVGILPTDLSAQVWYDSVALAGTLADAANVTAWNDSSGNGRTATYISGTTRTMAHNANGLGVPGVRFDGTDGLLRPAAWTPPVLDGGLCIVSLFYMQTNGGVNQYLAGASNSTGNLRGELYKNPSNKLTAFGSTALSDPSTLTFDTLHLAFAQFRADGTTQIFLDGALVAQGTTGTVPTGSSHSLGSTYAGLTAMKGWLMSQAMIPSVLTADQRYALTAGLSDRYGDLLAGQL
jgi:hypothetical protein